MRAIVFLGSEISERDKAALLLHERVGRKLKGKVLLIVAGTAPENYLGLLKDCDTVLFVDASDLDETKLLKKEDLSGAPHLTHSPPLDLIAEYLETEGKRVLFLALGSSEGALYKGELILEKFACGKVP